MWGRGAGGTDRDKIIYRTLDWYNADENERTKEGGGRPPIVGSVDCMRERVDPKWMDIYKAKANLNETREGVVTTRKTGDQRM